jgi:sodium transport system ATP-binding protein
MDDLLVFSSLTKSYRLNRRQRTLEKNCKIKTALSSLSFSVKKGEIYGLLGPNVAGKTTAMRINAGLIKSDSGDVFVDGISVRNNKIEVQRKIGFLSEDLRLEEFFTPDYLFDFFAALREVPKDTIKKRKTLLFERFGIDKYAHKQIAALSNGMKQMVSLVLSIVHDPPLLLFDEPTNGLDVVAAREVVDFLLEMKSQGKTIILSTHIFNLVEKTCDRVGIIIDGRMLYTGFLSEIEQSNLEEKFFSLYDECRRENISS